jgi:TRAP-type C4-dicarboxylate transport system permease small subunit
MATFKTLVGFFSRANDVLLAFGRQVAWICIALMVATILLQVFMRYVLNAALPWPEEAARALMLWMTGFVAPSAFRWGGFVAIDTIREAVKGMPGRVLSFLLLIIAMVVLLTMLRYGIKHVQSGMLFRAGSLPIKLAWIYAALPVGVSLMLLVGIELLLKQIHQFVDPSVEYITDKAATSFSAE